MSSLHEDPERGVLIRHSRLEDVSAILEIRNREIREGTALWIDEPTDLAERRDWWSTQTSGGHPVIVAELDGEVVGYASFGPWHPRTGFARTVENSVYLRPDAQGRGLGRLLLTVLVDLARTDGHHSMIADIEGGNTASIRLHESLGFVTIGVVPEAGFKFGRWFDLAILRLALE